MPSIIPGFSLPVPANKSGQPFSSAEELMARLGNESSGHYLVGSQGMWHGGIHITHETFPWCALSTDSEEEKNFNNNQPYKGEQFVRCMADGEIVAYRVCKDYDNAAINWANGKLHMSDSFVLIKHYIQPGDAAASGLTFYTLYMHLAPFNAYAQRGKLIRRVAKAQFYYIGVENVTAKPSKPGGMLKAGTAVTLSDNIISRATDKRQFTEVTLSADTKNAAGKTLAAGTKVWTVSDRGAFASAPSATQPSWWAKCAPAYGAKSGRLVKATTRTSVKYYLSSDDVQKGASPGSLAANFPLSYEPGNAAQQITRAIVEPGADLSAPTNAFHTFNLVTLGKSVGKLKKGDRVWIVSEADYLQVSTSTASITQALFGEVVKPSTAIPISAGDSIGHLGFYELPNNNGKKSRYQVHIECLSMEDVANFIGNPENAGEDKPAFLKFKPGLMLFDKDGAGQIVASERKTKSDGIVTLSNVPVSKEGDKPNYYQIRQEGGWIAAADAQLVSQYALAERGFAALNKSSASFDLIDGRVQPDNIVKEILQQLEAAAKADTRPGYALNQYNYQRLLAKIDSNGDGFYSLDEYLQALNNVSYRDRLQRIIAKHPSEWYYGKDDPMWKTYLNTLKGEHAKWKTYLETFIEKMTWMKQVPGMGPEPWHMHPVLFTDSLRIIKEGVTHEQLKRIFPLASDEDINAVVEELKGRLEIFKLDTVTRLRHFFSQIKGEVGSQMKGKTESLQFSPATLRSFSSYYRRHVSESEVDGYEKNSAGKIIKRANEQAIGRKHYLRLNGNRKNYPADGYDFRGRGLIQITGFEKYNRFREEYNNYWSGVSPDTINEPEKINSMPDAIRSALWFWIKYKPYNADRGRGLDDVSAVTLVVNGGSMGLDERKIAYELCEKVFL